MKRMIVRNKVKDFDHWKKIFDEQFDANKEAGLSLENLWQTVEDPNEVFFVLAIDDMDKAMAHISSPEAAEVGERSGVIDGELWIVE